MRNSLPLPRAPPNFTVVGVANGQGRYVLGHDKFFVSDTLHITSRFQRDVTLHDDVYLGLLSVVLIAIFSDILHTFILRSSRDTTRSRLRLVCAFLLSEFAHFRNVLRHCAPIHRILLANQQQHGQQHQSAMSVGEGGSGGNGVGIGGTPLTVRLSVKILFFTLLLFFADFLSIFYTQTVRTGERCRSIQSRCIPSSSSDAWSVEIHSPAGRRTPVRVAVHDLDGHAARA